jgi:hypothetical protein
MQLMQDRRDFLAGLSAAGAANVLGTGRSLADEGPPETGTMTVTGGGAGGSFAGPTTLRSARSGDNLTSVGNVLIESQEPL